MQLRNPTCQAPRIRIDYAATLHLRHHPCYIIFPFAISLWICDILTKVNWYLEENWTFVASGRYRRYKKNWLKSQYQTNNGRIFLLCIRTIIEDSNLITGQRKEQKEKRFTLLFAKCFGLLCTVDSHCICPVFSYFWTIMKITEGLFFFLDFYRWRSNLNNPVL